MANGTAAVTAAPLLVWRPTYVAALVLAVVGYSLITAASFFARGHWMADLIGNFRPHLFLGGLALAVVVLVSGLPRIALVPLVLASIHATWLLGPAPHAVAGTSAVPLRLTTMNVWSQNTAYDRTLNYLRRMRSDVVVLEETEPPWWSVVRGLHDLYPYATTEMPRGRRDIIILSRYPILHYEPVQLSDRTGRRLLLTAARVLLDVDGQPTVLYGIHPPSPTDPSDWYVRNTYHDAVARRVAAEDPKLPVIVAGDFNMTPWSPYFRDTLATGGTIDAAQTHWPLPTRHPEHMPWAYWLGVPIDHVLLTPGIGVHDYRVGPELGSDHQPVTADLLVGTRPAS